MSTVARVAALLTGVAVALLGSACDGAQRGSTCTLIGCDSGVTFELAGDLVEQTPYEVRACVDELCRSATLEVPAPEDGPFTGITVNDLTLMTDTDTILLTLPEGDWGGRHEVSIVVRDASGQIIERGDANPELLAEQPNGPKCPPTCWRATVVI